MNPNPNCTEASPAHATEYPERTEHACCYGQRPEEQERSVAWALSPLKPASSFLDLSLSLLLWNSGSNPCLSSRVAAVHNFLGGVCVSDRKFVGFFPLPLPGRLAIWPSFTKQCP